MKKLFLLQQEIGKISKGQENPFFKSKYFDINKLLEQLQPLLEKHQLLILQPLTRTVSDKPAITTLIFDAESGEKLTESKIPLPDLQDPQKMGSAITYYRRYSLQSLLGLQAEDDDGNKASGREEKKHTIPQMKAGLDKAEQVAQMKKGIKEFFDINSPNKLETADDYNNACMDMFGIELVPKNFETILNIINQ